MFVCKLRSVRGFVEILPSLAEGRFVGVRICAESIARDLQYMERLLGGRASYYKDCRTNLYGGDYHVTLVNSPEYSLFDKEIFMRFQGESVSIDLLGLGRVNIGEFDTVFIVCASSEMQSLRTQLSLEPYDFHITLGFNGSDVHGVAKGASSLVKRYTHY